MNTFRTSLIALLALGLSACSSMESIVDVPIKSGEVSLDNYDLSLHQRSIHIFDPINLEAKVKEKRLEVQVENLVLLMDLNLSGEEVRGVPVDIYQAEIVRRFVKTMPDGAFNILLVAHDAFSTEKSQRFEWTRDKDKILASLAVRDRVAVANGETLDETVEAVYSLINTQSGSSSIVLFSEWERINSATADAVSRLQQYAGASQGENFSSDTQTWNMQNIRTPSCLHLIGLNNYLSRSRASFGNCGLSKASAAVSQPADMAALVEHILYRGPMDSDNDGIFDYEDSCPNTEEGRVVDFSGCLKFIGAME